MVELNQNQALSEEDEIEEEDVETEVIVSQPMFKLFFESKGDSQKALMDVLLQ